MEYTLPCLPYDYLLVHMYSVVVLYVKAKMHTYILYTRSNIPHTPLSMTLKSCPANSSQFVGQAISLYLLCHKILFLLYRSFFSFSSQNSDFVKFQPECFSSTLASHNVKALASQPSALLLPRTTHRSLPTWLTELRNSCPSQWRDFLVDSKRIIFCHKRIEWLVQNVGGWLASPPWLGPRDFHLEVSHAETLFSPLREWTGWFRARRPSF